MSYDGGVQTHTNMNYEARRCIRLVLMIRYPQSIEEELSNLFQKDPYLVSKFTIL